MSKFQNITILVVEDEHYMRMLIIQALQSVGFKAIYEAEDGKRALQVMSKEQHIDLVISDIEMQPMNGLALAQQIRAGKAPIDPGTRFVFLTGLGDISTLTDAAELDVQGFISKPFSANQLKEKIEKALKMRVELRAPSIYEELVFGSAGFILKQKDLN